MLRHAIAETRRQGRPDAARELTPSGMRKLRMVLRRARQAGVSPAVILTSPYERAKQTAEAAAESLGCRKVIITKALVPSSSPADVWKQISGIEALSVLIVGHEPLLGQFVAFLLNCRDFELDLKKGTLVRLDVAVSEAHPTAVLKWMLTPKLAGA